MEANYHEERKAFSSYSFLKYLSASAALMNRRYLEQWSARLIKAAAELTGLYSQISFRLLSRFNLRKMLEEFSTQKKRETMKWREKDLNQQQQLPSTVLFGKSWLFVLLPRRGERNVYSTSYVRVEEKRPLGEDCAQPVLLDLWGPRLSTSG